MPQSPRWLLLNDRHDDAFTSMLRLRQTWAEKKSSSPASTITISEFNYLCQAMSALRTAPHNVSCPQHFLSIFSPVHRSRTAIVILLLFFQQSTGQSFASQYGTLFVKALHTVNPFSVTLATNAVDITGILLCMIFTDYFGRKLFLTSSALLQTAALLTMGGLGTADSTVTAAKVGIVAMLLLYSFGWSVGYAPLAYVLAAELPSPYLREYTLRVAYAVKLIMEFVISFTYPYLEDADEANLGGRLGFIYGTISFFGLIFSIFCVPETKNLELEEMDMRFAKGLFGTSRTSKDESPDAERQNRLTQV